MRFVITHWLITRCPPPHSAVFEFVCDLIYNITMSLVHTAIQSQVFECVLKQEIAFFDKASSGNYEKNSLAKENNNNSHHCISRIVLYAKSGHPWPNHIFCWFLKWTQPLQQAILKKWRVIKKKKKKIIIMAHAKVWTPFQLNLS